MKTVATLALVLVGLATMLGTACFTFMQMAYHPIPSEVVEAVIALMTALVAGVSAGLYFVSFCMLFSKYEDKRSVSYFWRSVGLVVVVFVACQLLGGTSVAVLVASPVALAAWIVTGTIMNRKPQRR